MPYKIILFFVLALFCATDCFPQDNPVKKDRIAENVTENYHVLPTNPDIKDGLYQAFYRRNKLIALGYYSKGKRIGVWRYYSPRGGTYETYNFDKDSIEYEAFENIRSPLRYYVDRELTDSDKTTKPYKIGGRYFGYLPYLTAFKVPFSLNWGDASYFLAQVELLISPLGRLADYKVHLIGPAYVQTFNLSLNFFKEEDKQFIPATVNKKPVISRILISCRVTDDGGLDFY
jgi:hypothetical protein